MSENIKESQGTAEEFKQYINAFEYKTEDGVPGVAISWPNGQGMLPEVALLFAQALTEMSNEAIKKTGELRGKIAGQDGATA
jgi:hypothetical protein